MNQPDARKWFIKCILALVVSLTFIALVVIIVDPYFHYHKPFSFLAYRLYEERYTNDGISRQFDFDAMITGSSITQNFKPSEMDALFETNTVKESFSGAGYQELADNLDRALSRNKDLKLVLWAVDYNGLLREYDWARYEDYPAYLYDDNPLNDASYLFNKSIFYHGVLPNIAMTLTGTPSTTMDEYSSWGMETGLEVVLASYDRDKLDPVDTTDFGEGEYNMVTQTITSNILRIVNKYPDTVFYIFYPPFSIFYWDSLNFSGTLERQLQAEQIATQLLLECPNVKLYNFFDQYDVICNADYYSDAGHYCEEINSRILQWIAEDTGLVTKENYLEKLAQERNFYSNYDYDSLYKK
ncbi:MAG: hypothetical protein HDR23_03720 [Lachnospiraceae bacterium]|nr:hypothetical protein [Lachnospiraceae bacterium]MBD5455570.1 hypothetical protein [Lachnospiraceae bacterium]